MKNMKRLLGLILAMVLLIGCLPISVFAQEMASGTCGDDLRWTFDAATGKLAISGNGEMTDYIYDGSSTNSPWYEYKAQIKTVEIKYGVTTIGECAFTNCENIISVIIPDSVTYIGWGAFLDCISLENIDFGSGVTDIDGFGFGNCKALESVVIGDGVKIIHEAAFDGCTNLADVSLPNGLEEIWEQAFGRCSSIESINIPISVVSIQNNAFSGCTSLSLINYEGTKSQWHTIARETNWDENNDFSINCTGTEVLEYTLNSDGASYSVTGIGNCYDVVAIPMSFTGLPITRIGQEAFSGCTTLERISVSDSIKYIEWGAFLDCTSLKNIDFGSGVTDIDGFAFGNCTSLESVVIGDGVKIIHEAAFNGCKTLKKIIITDSVEEIWEVAFQYCTNLTEITFEGNPPIMRSDIFDDVTATAYYPSNNSMWTSDIMQNYGGDITWVAYGSEPATSGTCGENLTWVFDEETGSLTISGTGAMTDYYYDAPWNCSDVKAVVVENGVTSIGDSAFANCANMAEITIPESVTRIGAAAIQYCTSLTELNIPNSVTFVGEIAFGGNSGLTSVTIPDNGIEIGSNAFAECIGLTSITIPGSADISGQLVFRDCTGLKEIVFEGNVPTFGSSTFSDVTATAYYPADNPAWTEEVMLDYGGDITWVAYGDTTEEPAITGYSAGLSTTTPTTTTGEKVYVSVAVNHVEETTFNAGELVFSYDPARLTFDQANSTLGNATVKAENGTLILEDYGAAKNCGNGIYTLVFDAIADGNATVKLTSAAFSNQENAAASDLIAGVAYPDSVSIAVSKKSFAVTLPDGMTGASTVTDGNSYTFRISDQNYTYSNIAATVDGQTVSVTDNGDGSYTINSVSGALNITATRTPKSYKVSFTGSAAADITGAAATATYGTDYKFTIPAADGWAYSLGGITIGGNSYTGYSAEGSEYTIHGTAVTGDIVITVNKEQTTASVTVTGSGAGAAAGYDATAEIGESYTLTITPENGYNYTVTATMGGKPVELTQDGNKYTIAEVTGDIVFTVERTVIVSGVTVSEYVSVDGNKVWLIQNTVTLAGGKVPTYNGGNMFWSEEYDAYCYLVIAATLSEEDAKAAIGIADGSAVVVDYGMDVNMTGNVDANDAQLTYNIYNAYYNAFSEAATMEKFLRADVNKDGKVNTTDSAAIINKILNG